MFNIDHFRNKQFFLLFQLEVLGIEWGALWENLILFINLFLQLFIPLLQ